MLSYKMSPLQKSSQSFTDGDHGAKCCWSMRFKVLRPSDLHSKSLQFAKNFPSSALKVLSVLDGTNQSLRIELKSIHLPKALDTPTPYVCRLSNGTFKYQTHQYSSTFNNSTTRRQGDFCQWDKILWVIIVNRVFYCWSRIPVRKDEQGEFKICDGS
jgi:hypothetical protein